MRQIKIIEFEIESVMKTSFDNLIWFYNAPSSFDVVDDAPKSFFYTPAAFPCARGEVSTPGLTCTTYPIFFSLLKNSDLSFSKYLYRHSIFYCVYPNFSLDISSRLEKRMSHPKNRNVIKKDKSNSPP